MIIGTGGAGKAVVIGILRRGSKIEASKVTAPHVPDTTAATLHPQVKAAVAPGSELFTDAQAAIAVFLPTTSIRSWTIPSSMSVARFIRTGWKISGACSSAP